MENTTKFVTGKVHWASLTAPNTTYEPVWCIDVSLDEESKVELESLGLNVQNKGDDRGDFIKIMAVKLMLSLKFTSTNTTRSVA